MSKIDDNLSEINELDTKICRYLASKFGKIDSVQLLQKRIRFVKKRLQAIQQKVVDQM